MVMSNHQSELGKGEADAAERFKMPVGPSGATQFRLKRWPTMGARSHHVAGVAAAMRVGAGRPSFRNGLSRYRCDSAAKAKLTGKMMA